MSELPPEAKELLALARDAHNPPDPSARERVRRGVAAAVAVGAGVALSGKAIAAGTKGGILASTGAKLAGLGSVLVLATVVVVAPLVKRDQTSTPARRPPTDEPRAKPVEEPAIVEEVEGEVDGQASDAPERVSLKRERPSREAAESLRREVALLGRASDALTAGRVDKALRLLAEHERRYARSQLKVERDGLRVIAHCLRGEPKAERAARAYLKKNPDSVLAVRAMSACKLKDAP